MREDWGTEQNCNILTPHSIGHNSVSFPFSCAAQPRAWGPTLLGASFLYRILSPTHLTSSLHPAYIIVRHPPSSSGRHKSHLFSLSTVKVISWYSWTGCTCYLHRCITYFDTLAGVNMLQPVLIFRFFFNTYCYNFRSYEQELVKFVDYKMLSIFLKHGPC